MLMPPQRPDATPVLQEAQRTAAATPQGQTQTRNAQILEASLHVSIQAGNEGMRLLYSAAVDAINTELAPTLGPNAIQNALGQDNSPEATAGRIVSLSTAMFHTYASLHPDKDLEEVARAFVDVIRTGFEQGYAEAQQILHGLGVLGEGSPIAAGIAQTWELVHKGYDDWLAQQIDSIRAAQGDTAAPAPATDA